MNDKAIALLKELDGPSRRIAAEIYQIGFDAGIEVGKRKQINSMWQRIIGDDDSEDIDNTNCFPCT